ncbi:hypothetical protein EDB19DRAFT_910387 [Suillus lakei]|nr:hypothetical protein EDB19DRAFT_910387 [Suillus lakei]
MPAQRLRRVICAIRMPLNPSSHHYDTACIPFLSPSAIYNVSALYGNVCSASSFNPFAHHTIIMICHLLCHSIMCRLFFCIHRLADLRRVEWRTWLPTRALSALVVTIYYFSIGPRRLYRPITY